MFCEFHVVSRTLQRGQRSGEGGLWLVFDSVVVIDGGFYRRRPPVFLQTQSQTQSDGRHLQVRKRVENPGQLMKEITV